VVDRPSAELNFDLYYHGIHDDYLVAKAALKRLNEIYRVERDQMLAQVPWYRVDQRARVVHAYDEVTAKVTATERAFDERVASFQKRTGFASGMVWDAISALATKEPNLSKETVKTRTTDMLRSIRF
jgi:hypothetical protein